MARIEIEVDLEDYAAVDALGKTGERQLRSEIRRALEQVPGITNVWDIEMLES